MTTVHKRTYEWVATDRIFIEDKPPLLMIRGVCEHNLRWALPVVISNSELAAELAADPDFLEGYVDNVPGPSCDKHYGYQP